MSYEKLGDNVDEVQLDVKQENVSHHTEAVELVERHRDFFEHYARGRVKIAPAPPGLDTFAFDLKENTIYINSRFYTELGLGDAQTTFATLHEIEHFSEKKQILAEVGGEKAFEKYVARIQESKAYGLMDNCIADTRENSAVQSRVDGFVDVERNMYTQDLFKETDFTKDPRHIQFAQAILRESRVPDEVCTVAPEVRVKLDELKAVRAKDGTSVLDIMANPETLMSTRLKLQDKFVWPMMKELLDEDVKDEKEKNKKNDDSEKGDSDKIDEPKESEGENKKSKAGDGEEQESNPNETFKDAYERANKKVPNAMSVDEMKKILKESKEQNKESPLQKADREYAEKIGVKKEDLEKYRQIVAGLESVINPETNESIISELRDLIARIIAKRTKPKHSPRYPVEEGEDLIDPVQLVSDAKAGNFEPKVWETLEVKQRPGQRFGEVEITVVCDRSGSMKEGSKLTEQKKATVFIMEALKEFADMADEEAINLEKPLEIRSEVYSFQSSAEDSIPLKKMGKELGEKERIDVMTKMSSASGSTTDFVPLEKINSEIDEETQKKITEGELKKIVVVFTDGESDDSVKVQEVLKNLRDKGVLVVGVGITEAGKPALVTYAPDARLAETAEKLLPILADVLKDSLKDI